MTDIGIFLKQNVYGQFYGNCFNCNAQIGLFCKHTIHEEEGCFDYVEITCGECGFYTRFPCFDARTTFSDVYSKGDTP